MFLKYVSIVVLGGATLGCTINDNLQTNNAQNKPLSHTSSKGEIFTYDFDPSLPQVDMGITGTLVEKDGCLLLEAPTGKIYLTPIFPSGISRWDKQNNSVHIGNKEFLVGKELMTNGVLLDTRDKSEQARAFFKEQAEVTCLEDRSARLGTHTF